MVTSPEESIIDMKRIYKEYLNEEDVASHQFNLTHSFTNVLKYLGVRMALGLAIYPFESAILLRQVQFGSVSEPYQQTLSEEITTPKGPNLYNNDERSPTLEEQVNAYEKYLLRPPQSVHSLIHNGGDGNDTKSPVLPTDPLGYVIRPTSQLLDPSGLVLTVETKLPLVLDKKLAVTGSISQIIRRHGFFSLWQGTPSLFKYS
jgi:hypothetical protein